MWAPGQAGTERPALELSAQRRRPLGVRGVMAGHGAAEILWARRWGAAFIVVFRRLPMRLCNRR